MQFDKDENLIVAVAGMGVYGIKPDGEVFKVTDETNRTWYKLNDDSRLRMADDLDIAPDGKIYFSDCTTRYEMTTNTLDIIEGRPNGRLVCYDPATSKTWTVINHFYFPERHLRLARRPFGADCQHLAVQGVPLLARRSEQGSSRWCSIEFPGNPRQHQPRLRRQLLACAGRHPHAGVRSGDAQAGLPPAHGQAGADRRMAGAGLNHGCVLKFTERGEVLESYWDPTGISHPTLTSMREHKGYLYLGGLENNRIGRIKLDGRRSDLDRLRSLLGQQAASTGTHHGVFSPICCATSSRSCSRYREQHAIPLDGRRAQPERSAGCLQRRSANRSPAPTTWSRASGRRALRLRQAAGAGGWRATGLPRREVVAALRRQCRRACLSSRRPPAGLRLRPWPRGCSIAAGRSPRWLEQAADQPLNLPDRRRQRRRDGTIFLSDGSSRHVPRGLVRRPYGEEPAWAGWSLVAPGLRPARTSCCATCTIPMASRSPPMARLVVHRKLEPSPEPVRRCTGQQVGTVTTCERNLPGYPARLASGRGRRLLAQLLRACAPTSSNSCCAKTITAKR